MSEPSEQQDLEPVVYELWSDEELRWIEIGTPSVELASFLEAWCDKHQTFFRRRPWRNTARGTQQVLEHPIHQRVDLPAGEW